MTMEKAKQQRTISHTIFVALTIIFFICKFSYYAIMAIRASEDITFIIIAGLGVWIVICIAMIITTIIHKNFDDYTENELNKRETTFNTVATISGITTNNYNLVTAVHTDTERQRNFGSYRTARNVSCVPLLIANTIAGLFEIFAYEHNDTTIFTALIIACFILIILMILAEYKWRVANTFIKTGQLYNKHKIGVIILYIVLILIGYGPQISLFISL